MDPLEHYARFALQILIVAGSILDIACLKWRHIANWLLYHECLLRCVALLIRNRFAQENSIIDITMLFVWIGVCQYCDSGRQIICLTVSLAFHLVFDSLAYNRDLTVMVVTIGFTCLIGFLIAATTFGMVFLHISDVHGLLQFSNEENIKLLNGMHEGILILNKSTEKRLGQVMFCNRPAQKLINTFLGSLVAPIVKNANKYHDEQQSFISQKRFYHVSNPEAESDEMQSTKKHSKYSFINLNEKTSLEEIVLIQCDEPKQKNFVYMLSTDATDKTSAVEKFYQIRVKSIEFVQKRATAIYFYDCTSQIMAMELNVKLISKEKRNTNLFLSQISLSHEFRAPLTCILMLLESTLSKIIDQALVRVIFIIISQINLILCSVNDLIDHKMIEQGVFKKNTAKFQPTDTFAFILSVFKQQLLIQGSSLTFQV